LTEQQKPESRLAQVTGDLNAPRGADGSLTITVPPQWLEQGSRLLVRVPKKLVCAACEGGGCDACARSGALTLPETSEEERVLAVTLPSLDGAHEVALRIPGRGMPSKDPTEPAGHLILKIVPGPSPSPSVAVDRTESSRGLAHLDRSLIARSTLMAVGLILLFLGMLRLSGWM
jgi:hypothetical protein